MKYLPLSGVKKNRTDFEKLQEEYWYYLPVPQRESLIVKIFANYMSENIHLNATFFFVKEDEDPQMNGTNGYYDHAERIICINEGLLHLNQGLMAYSVLTHELVHVSQNYLVDHAEKFPDKEEEIELLNIYLNGTDRKINFCDMKDVDANFHITDIGQESEIINLFYYLNISERKAYKKQSIIYEESNRLSIMYKRFNDIYKTNLNNQQIENLVDICFMNLFKQDMPLGTYEEQSLQATVMYDIAIVSHYVYKLTYSEFIIDKPFVIDYQQKKLSLAKYGYTIYNEDPVNDLMEMASSYIMGEKEIKDLTLEQQKVNPKLLLLCLNFEKITIDDIKDKESFLYELHKMYDSLPTDLQDYVNENVIDVFKKEHEEIKEWN